MDTKHINKIADELGLSRDQIMVTVELIEGGSTVPFIARYRKEATGSLDEVAITTIRDRLGQLQDLDRRRESILKSLMERQLLTDELKEKISTAESLTTLEDIYLPFKPKRRTRATIAREKGLEPLAGMLFKQDEDMDPLVEAGSFVDQEKGVESAEDALAGARDIIAEWVNENQKAREKMRRLYGKKGFFRVKAISGKEQEGAKYRDYFDLEEPVTTAPSHRILAMRRGAKEGFLNLRVSPPEDEALELLEGLFVKGDNAASLQVKEAVHDSYRRLLSSAMETEMRLETKARADAEAIKVFAANLRELLLAPPLGQKNVLAIDPGIRTGCKVVCLDRQGKLLHTETIYLFKSEKERSHAVETLSKLCREYKIEAIAVGNGTGGRETESFIGKLDLPEDLCVVMVNESGASVYSASEAARKEFPDLDLTFRGAVSIGRRLMDPLAELVKIDPKSIGVGQYQHDVNQMALKKSLDDVVTSCVNAVGVEVNTASEQLLTYVSGIGPKLARNIITHRNDHGPLASREELKKVKGMGPKAFEQAAGFLRIRGGKNPLDASAVHPESYPVVEAMARDLGCSIVDLMENETLCQEIDLSAYVTEKVGMPTLKDIMKELAKPGRDPRKQFEIFGFTEGIEEIGDVRAGMRLPGVVTNVTAFGAFVDIGVHQDGLVHISQLANGFVKDPGQVVKVNQRVMVTVLDVDLERRRISLSMKDKADQVKKQDEKRAKPDKEKKPTQKRRKTGPTAFNNPFAEALKR
ncbi:MAG: RNA-binding transcriptional accessory protein [Deltaproteobacteria bacterium]|nr:MAG: RNA-binding transcriptional accessory protein [Desulfobacteraceae bacterium 4484_190.3]RLB17658.1 MAG: RNA-binding transcriptional accessory protein [Deltaproteobacteria bacterium]